MTVPDLLKEEEKRRLAAVCQQEGGAHLSALADVTGPCRAMPVSRQSDSGVGRPSAVGIAVFFGRGGCQTQLMAKRGNVVAIDINPAFVDLANRIRNVVAHITTNGFGRPDSYSKGRKTRTNTTSAKAATDAAP